MALFAPFPAERYKFLNCAFFTSFQDAPPNDAGGADPQRQPIGVSAQNQPVFAPYRSTVRHLANEIPRLAKSGLSVGASIPAPAGFEFKGATNSRLHLTLSGPGATLGVAVVSSDT